MFRVMRYFFKNRDRWPEVINGYVTRPEKGPCPNCNSPEDKWCDFACDRLDPLDYR
jgi:hypothetical protein